MDPRRVIAAFVFVAVVQAFPFQSDDPSPTTIPKKIVVTTIEDTPWYIQSKERGREVCLRSEGFIADVVAQVADHVGFEYEFQLVKDGRYGGKSPEGTWNGMIGEVYRKEADLAAAPLTVVSSRLEAVDFTLPFSSVGLTILYRRPDQGQTISFQNAQELLDADIPFGVINGGSTMRFFQNSQNPLYHKMWLAMRRRGPTSFLQTSEEGVQRVRKGNFAFITEEDFARKVTHRRPCDVITVGPSLASRYYAFAVQKESPLRGAIGKALVNMQENGQMDKLQAKHWPDQCSDLE